MACSEKQRHHARLIRLLPTLRFMSSASDLLGTVTQRLPSGGEHRPGQEKMADLVAETLATTGIALIEAGTGTGKSLAYLTPIVAAGTRTVVATATIALQSQLVNQDVALVAEGLDRPVVAAVLKGRNNYLCMQRYEELVRADRSEQLDLLRGTRQDDSLGLLTAWADHTETGDREDLDPSPPVELWQAVSVGGDECPGANRCPAGDRCFAEQARARAMDADIIVTNHHYYGLDLAAGGILLPDHDAAIFDEAHHLPEALSATCGSELSGARFRALARRARAVLADSEVPALLDKSGSDHDNLLRDEIGDRADMTLDLVQAMTMGRDRVDKVLAELRKANPTEGSDAAARVERATRMATSLANDIDQVLESSDSDVLWVDGTPAAPILRRTPLDIAAVLEEGLWGKKAVVLTSATLPDGLVPQLGLPDSTSVTRVGSPFDFATLGMLYCPTHLPGPRHANFAEEMHHELVDLIEAAGGRTLALFTSYRAMQSAAEHLRAHCSHEILLQGEGSRAMLTDRFRSDPRSVLLATQSFWQGVDLPGDTLTLVTIDKLPFPRPDDPVLMARRRRAGPEAFRMIDLPRAQILLAQATGRLIRRSDDHGVVAIFDTRLATNKSYRWDFINALPPLRRTRDKAEVIEFLRRLDRQANLAEPGQ